MRLAWLADNIFAFLFNCFGQPGSADFRERAIVQNRVFFDRHLFSKVVTLLGPTLKLILSALAFAKQLIPGVRRTLVIPSINFEKGVDEFVGT
jgi:hypothetical protein